MSFTFRPAVRENVGLLIGLIAPSGGGKTYTAMRLAIGIAGEKRFCVIDTEAGRAKHYADQFAFDHGDLKPPFTPDAYAEAIHAADAAGYPVIVVDSMSHEWAGDGGILDMQEAEFQRMGGRDSAKLASWIKPKMAHKQMVQKLLQIRAHLILCFRAEEKVDVIREDGKMKIVPKVSLTGIGGWQPICEKSLPFELTVSLLLTPEAPGVPKPIKLQEQHKSLFPLVQPITEEAGRKIAEWANGNSPSRLHTTLPPGGNGGSSANSEILTGFITVDQALELAALCKDHDISERALCSAAKVDRLDHITDYARAKKWIETAIRLRRGT
ncbi:MAG: AAA family ATPase [Candidatus Micrarchaeota archaeon]|nr:AAA family ATPase [Candidatus Micrarchaeota archaeon]